MKYNTIFNKLLALSVRVSILVCITIVAPHPALGIKLTKVTHQFDIAHKLKEPSDVAVSKSGRIYVVDGVNNRVVVFNKEGRQIFSFGEKGAQKGRFLFPLGIDVDSAGNVYVADSGNHRVQIFNASGGYKAQIKIPTRDGIPSDPTDIAVDAGRNRMYVADNDNHYILVYDATTLELLDTYGAPGMEKREFRYPFFMTLDDNNYLYIVDVINTRVQVLNPDGKFVMIIGGWGVERGEFFRPKGVAVDRNNRVYVSDGYLGVIQVFRSTGEFYSAVGDTTEGKVKKFNTPAGIFIDDNNRLYVVEMFANRISVYNIESDAD
jgi:DNA-binding beta-propeller fold protein YncE